MLYQLGMNIFIKKNNAIIGLWYVYQIWLTKND